MFKYILKYWSRNKKIITHLIGAILICSGLSILISLSETSQGTIVETLQKKWKASYDIVVRPSNVEGISMVHDYLDPNYLSGLSGGITVSDWQKIKEIENVEIAAPISMIGYTMLSLNTEEINVEPGLYKYVTTISESDGAREYSKTIERYYSSGHRIPYNLHEFGLLSDGGTGKIIFGNTINVLIAAIDPQEEAKLVGLNNAIVEEEPYRYFSQSDIAEVQYHEGMEANIISIPVLVSSQLQVQQAFSHKLIKLDIPYDSSDEVDEVIDKIQNNGGEEYLKTIPESTSKEYTFHSNEAYAKLLDNFKEENSDTHFITEKTSPLKYKIIDSPFPNRWKYAFEIDTPDNTESSNVLYNNYRNANEYHEPIRIIPKVIGLYNPQELNLSIDPINEVPMETYRSATATLVLNEKEEPINPPIDLIATSNPYGYIMQPPSMLTTIEAAEKIMGNKPISAIRIKVKGVEELSNASQAKLEKVVQEIEQQTGLKADITLGSSPEPLLIHIPEIEGEKELGWMEQPWLKYGASYGIFTETKLGYSGLITLLIIVSIIYVFATNLVSYLYRKREFAMLQALGWKTKKIRGILLVESLTIGIIVSLTTFIVMFIIRHNMNETLEIKKMIILSLFILLIYLLGALGPSYFVSRINPTEILKQGEISVKGARLIKIKGLLSLVINTIFGRWTRNFISILSIALPSGLLMMFIFVSIKLQGTMYTTWLGQYVSMNVGIPHYISITVCLFISILTTYEIMSQNLQDRIKEISLLKSLGWKSLMVRISVILEGGLIGFIAGIFGVIVCLSMLMIMYGTIPISELWIFVVSFVFPVIVGILGAWVPAKKAMKLDPNIGLKYE
jgi:putative ABC transport system permease protein